MSDTGKAIAALDNILRSAADGGDNSQTDFDCGEVIRESIAERDAEITRLRADNATLRAENAKLREALTRSEEYADRLRHELEGVYRLSDRKPTGEKP